MCGISGFYDTSASRELLESMMQTMHHRGPDHHDAFFDTPAGLAHNRLSIIDLSARANQPMHYMHVVMVLNGEIYNYIEIRSQLQHLGFRFSTTSDTEVAAAAYIAWGRQCVQHFIGMWAFAIWDKQEKKLFCSRDRFGIKPLYYILSGNRFYFGSEYKPLKRTPVFKTRINEMQVARGLQLGWAFYDDETYYDCIKRLPAAHNLTYDGANLEISRYWDIDLKKKIETPEEERFATFRNLFADSVKLQMRSDVKVGSCLSGGIDSSAIVSMASTLYPQYPMDTFTIFYDGKHEVDERPWVQEVIKKYPNLNPHFYQPSDNDLSDAFVKAAYHADVPLMGSSYLSQYFVMQLAAQQKIKVLLDGQGSDEYLAGYLHSFDRLFGDMLRKGQVLKTAGLLQRLSKMHHQSYSEILYTALKSFLSVVSNENRFYHQAFRHKFPWVMRIPSGKAAFTLSHQRGSSRFDEFLYHLIFATSLPVLLHFEDRNSMAFSIESRVPFLDHRLVEYSFLLGQEDKIHRIETKHILRHSLQGILPDAIVRRQDKKGFVTPGEDKWLSGPLKHLLDMDFTDYEFIDNNKVKKIVAAYRERRANPVLVWRLAALHHWLTQP